MGEGGWTGNTWNAYCSRCPATEHGRPLIGVGNRDNCKQLAAVHFANAHPDMAMILEGRDFEIMPATYRCDVCNVPAEPPFWEYRVPPQQIPVDNDGLWLVCDACHPLLILRDTAAVVSRHTRFGIGITGISDPRTLAASARNVSTVVGILTAANAVIRRQKDWEDM